MSVISKKVKELLELLYLYMIRTITNIETKKETLIEYSVCERELKLCTFQPDFDDKGTRRTGSCNTKTFCTYQVRHHRREIVP